MRMALLFSLLISLAGCGDDGRPTDAGADTSATVDSSTGDTSTTDSSTPADSSTPTDSSAPDASDASSPDASDATTSDAFVGECEDDADCRAFSNYCDGCACDALLVSEPDPVCSGTMVACFVDPCSTVGPVRCNPETKVCEISPT